MLNPEEKPDGSIKVHFADNTYKTVSLRRDTPARDVVEWLCKRISVGGRVAEPSRHELLVISPSSQAALRERRLEQEDQPLQVQQDSGGAAAIKFLFRESWAVDGASGSRSETPQLADEAAIANTAGATEKPDGDRQGPAQAGLGADAADVAARLATTVADAASRTRKGTLEQLIDGATWHSCTVILAEDRFWYSQAPSSQGGHMGGGMASVKLHDCDKVIEGEDKRDFVLVTKSERMTFRAKSKKEQEGWLLAIVGQTALVKEKDILMQAEQIVAKMELRKASQHMANLEAFSRLQGVIEGPQETRQLFADFVRSEHAQAQEGQGVCWPEDVSLGDVLAHLSVGSEGAAAAALAGEGGAPEGASPGSEAISAAWAFMEDVLFVRFREHPVVQRRLCCTAAGIWTCPTAGGSRQAFGL